MSTVGKILVVAQVIFSVLLMAFAGGVASVQSNWKEKATKKADEQRTTADNLSKATAEIDRIKTDWAATKKTLESAADSARAQVTAANEKIKDFGTQLAQSRSELENMRAEARIAGEEARARRDEAVAMRTINAQLHQKRDEVITANRQQADTINNLEQKARTNEEKHSELLNNYATLQKFLRVKGFDADPKEVAGLSEPPPVIYGMVLNAIKGRRNERDLVEISLGSDMGLAKGHKLYVYRTDGKGKYLGTIQLDSVDYRTSVGSVIAKNGEIQKGDHVTSKL